MPMLPQSVQIMRFPIWFDPTLQSALKEVAFNITMEIVDHDPSYQTPNLNRQLIMTANTGQLLN